MRNKSIIGYIRQRSKKNAPPIEKPIKPDININPALKFRLDKEFYRATYPDLMHMDDKSLEDHWLNHGYHEGRLSSASHASGNPVFANEPPSDFDTLDTVFYAQLYSDLANNGVATDEALRTHFQKYGKEEGRIPNLSSWLKSQGLPLDFAPSSQSYKEIVRINQDSGLLIGHEIILGVYKGNVTHPIKFYENKESTARHYLYMARHFLAIGQKHEGRNLLKTSLTFYPLPAALELLGNIFMEEGHLTLALGYYDAAQEKQNPPKWLYLNRASTLSRLYRPLEAVKSIAKGLKANPDFSFQLDKLAEFAQKAWDTTYALLMTHAERDEREQMIEAASEYATTIYDAYLCAYGVEKTPATLSHINLEKVLIIADYHVPQCVRYRIEQKIEQLQAIGKKVTAVDWTKLDQHQNEVAAHHVVIFYRVPATPKVLQAMAQTNATGKLSIYEIDDLLFDATYPPPIETYGGYVTLNTHLELMRGMALFNAAARLCRVGIASTEPLRRHLAKIVFGGECLLHRNGLDHLNEIRTPNRLDKQTVDIFYGSGTQAHNSDFIDLALPAIEKVLAQNIRARLIVVGYLKLPQSFTDKYETQLKQLPPVKSVQGYWSLLESADINIAVLHDDEINACKSELKWFEAACFGLPSVVSDTENYRDVIRHGEDAIIARTSDDWYQALKHLVENPKERERIGKAALERVQKEYSVEALSNKLNEQLEDVVALHQPAERIATKKRKIALVNVFFPPQSIGGATRVVADNFKVLKAHHSDNFELCVFTADAECRTPHQLSVYDLDGTRIYRATTLWREHMDWHPKDQKMYELFAEFLELEQPDLIHFHCVQRLTASVVEAARDAKIPYLVTVHDAWWISDFQFLVDHKGKVYPEGHPDPFTPIELPPNITPEESIERKYFLKGLLHGAKEVLTVSNAFADIYRSNGIGKVHVIPNGISDDIPWAPKDTSHTKRVVGGHIGGMSEHKGYFILKEAILETQPQNMEFLIVDHSKEEGYESKEQWGKVPVTFIGRVSQERILELYRKIDVLFATSIWPESFGLVTREAAACHCWVVASNLGGIGEDVIEGKTGHIIEPTLKSVIEILKHISIQSSIYKRQAAANATLRIEQQVVRLMEFYKKI